MTPTLVVRADASARIGTGHVMRCLALSQAWQDAGGQAIFALAMAAPATEARLQAEGMQVVRLSAEAGSVDDACEAVDLANKVEADWIVVDGYHFGVEYQQRIKAAGRRLLFIDDMGEAKYYSADLILNQNLHANERLYANREPYTKLLLGTRYALLRREFLKWRDWKREIPDVARKVLVTLGGGDPDNVTLKAIEALQQVKVDRLEAIIMVGESNPHREGLQSAVQASRCPIRIETHVTNMPELMAWADVAVSGGGSTCWELAFMGVPALIIILAENQRPVAEGLQAGGVGVNWGAGSKLHPSALSQALAQLLRDQTAWAEMSRLGKLLIDGEGSRRVLQHLQGPHLTLRRALEEEDCRLLWEWANEADTRAMSFSTEPIAWEKHVQWLRSKLDDPCCYLYIATDHKGRPIGQVRYDVNGSEATVSVSLDPAFRGHGYGTVLIRLSAQEVLSFEGVRAINAYIKRSNEAAIRAFTNAGYRLVADTTVRGQPALLLTLRRNP